MAPESLRTDYSDASAKDGRGATLRDLYVQESWSTLAEKESMNSKELRSLGKALRLLSAHVRGQLFLASMGENSGVCQLWRGACNENDLTYPKVVVRP